MKKILLYFLIFMMSILGLWCAGLVLFTSYATGIEQSTTTQAKADAIIVLTGDKNRIEEALYLFATKRAPLLFISGVDKSVEKDDLISRWEGAPLPGCCIDLGYSAMNTWGNALESDRWLEANNIKSIFLVTSDYHMPRALMEFSYSSPEVTVYPHPVYNTEEEKIGFIKKLIAEYHKSALTFIRNKII